MFERPASLSSHGESLAILGDGDRATTPRHLIQVLDSFERGGSETVARDLALRLDRTRLRSSACALGGGGPLEGDFARAGIPTYVIARRPGFDWPLIRRLHGFFRRERADIVQTHHVTQLIYAGAAARLAGAKLIHVEHDYFTLSSLTAQRCLRLLSPLCHKIVAVSDEVGEFLRGAGLSARCIIVIRNGVDLAVYRPVSRTSHTSMEPVIGHVARMDPSKDQGTLLHAFSLVVRSYPNARLLVVGDGSMAVELRSLAQALNLGDRVEFLGLRRDVADLLPQFDVFVLSSVAEGLPLVILEAMASGVPVVATDVGSVAHVVRDGITGFVVKPRDAVALADHINIVLREPHLAQKMGREGRRVVEEHFDLASTVCAYERLYESVP